MSRKFAERFDTAGWLFWIFIFAILLAPCLYGAWQIPYTRRTFTYPIGIGVAGAAVSAGFVSWAVNAVLQTWVKRKRKKERKKLRKQK